MPASNTERTCKMNTRHAGRRISRESRDDSDKKHSSDRPDEILPIDLMENIFAAAKVTCKMSEAEIMAKWSLICKDDIHLRGVISLVERIRKRRTYGLPTAVIPKSVIKQIFS
uniref:Uncharacterized protein n=1 Tax=Bracon brevicornis TaxID=1563983 RepID=A0A6V7J5U9_9HYME